MSKLHEFGSDDFIFDTIAASQLIDGAGEELVIKNTDISDFKQGKGWINWEHKGDNDIGHTPLDIVGKIIFAKKILTEKDCENDRMKMYWERVKKSPYIYVVGRLFTSAQHPGALALAAIMRDQEKNKGITANNLMTSIEGSTLLRRGNVLEESIARRLAVTTKSCNKTCDITVLQDPLAPEGYKTDPNKSTKEVKDALALILEDSKKNEDPLYTKLGSSTEFEYVPLTKNELDLNVVKLLVKGKLLKALSAGSYGAAPSTLTGGAALQVEDQSLKRNRLKAVAKAAIRDYEGKFNKGEFRSILKHKLPEVDDSFLDYFTDLADDYHVKKIKKSLGKDFGVRKMEALTIDLKKAYDELKDKDKPKSRYFAGYQVIPGVAKTADDEYELLHEDATHYTGHPKGKSSLEYLVRLPKKHENTHYKVHSKPMVLVSDLSSKV